MAMWQFNGVPTATGQSGLIAGTQGTQGSLYAVIQFSTGAALTITTQSAGGTVLWPGQLGQALFTPMVPAFYSWGLFVNGSTNTSGVLIYFDIKNYQASR